MQGRFKLQRRFARGRLPRPWRRANLGNGDRTPNINDARHARPGHSRDEDASGSNCGVQARGVDPSPRRRSGPSLGEHREPRLPLPRHAVLREHEEGRVYDRGSSESCGQPCGSREGLLISAGKVSLGAYLARKSLSSRDGGVKGPAAAAQSKRPLCTRLTQRKSSIGSVL
jgi:hypothetical protein